MYRFDTHVHTSETSPCGNVSAKDTIRLYQDAGYSGVCITDHLYERYFNRLNAPSWENAVDCYLKGYKKAKDAGNRLEVDVLLGAEIQLTGSPNEYLLYGITEEFLYKHPYLYTYTIDKLRTVTSEFGILIFQAHPFRPNLTRANPRYLDGMEVVNGNPRHNSHNDLAMKYANENSLAISAGSDCHEIGDVGRGGIITAARITTLNDLKVILMNGKFQIVYVKDNKEVNYDH